MTEQLTNPAYKAAFILKEGRPLPRALWERMVDGDGALPLDVAAVLIGEGICPEKLTEEMT